MAKYSVDTSTLIEGWMRDFPPDILPSAWRKIEELIDDDILVATEEVLFEIERKHDELYVWARNNAKLFIPIDSEIQLIVKSILRNHERLLGTQKRRSGADPWVIALALQHRLTVVTKEVPTGNPNKPRIPDVCQALGVRYINWLGLFREQGWSL